MRDQYWGSEKEKEEVTKKVTSPMDLELSDNADFNQVDHSGNRIYFYSGRQKINESLLELIFWVGY